MESPEKAEDLEGKESKAEVAGKQGGRGFRRGHVWEVGYRGGASQKEYHEIINNTPKAWSSVGDARPEVRPTTASR